MSRFRAIIGGALLLVAVEAAPVAASEPVEAAERVAIFRLEFFGSVGEPLRDSLAARLAEGLTTVGFEVLHPGGRGPARVAPGPRPSCNDPSCFREMADTLGAKYLVGARVDENAKTFEITLELVSGRSGAIVGTNRERCEICGAEEVGEKMSLAAAALRARLLALAHAPARFVVRTRPHGASIKIDDRPVGHTPVDLNLAAGSHRMLIEHQGYSPLDRSFTVTSGVDESLELDLVRLPSPFPFRAAGWSALLAGALLAGGGVYVLGLDGREVSCAADVKDLGGRCPRIYRTNLVGAGLLGLSAVSATLGGVWLYLAPPAGRQSQERAGGFGFGFTGAF